MGSQAASLKRRLYLKPRTQRVHEAGEDKCRAHRLESTCHEDGNGLPYIFSIYFSMRFSGERFCDLAKGLYSLVKLVDIIYSLDFNVLFKYLQIML